MTTPMAHRRQLRLAGRRVCGRELHYVMTKVSRQVTTVLRKCTADRQPQVLPRRQDQLHLLHRVQSLVRVSRVLELVETALLLEVGRRHLIQAQVVGGVPCKPLPHSVACGVRRGPQPRCNHLRYGSDHVRQEPLRKYLPRIDWRHHPRRLLSPVG